MGKDITELHYGKCRIMCFEARDTLRSKSGDNFNHFKKLVTYEFPKLTAIINPFQKINDENWQCEWIDLTMIGMNMLLTHSLVIIGVQYKAGAQSHCF